MKNEFPKKLRMKRRSLECIYSLQFPKFIYMLFLVSSNSLPMFQSSWCEKDITDKFHLAYLCLIPESIPQNRMWAGISTCPTISAGCMSYKQQFELFVNLSSINHKWSCLLLDLNTYLADHCKKFIGFTTCWSHLVHYTTWSSNNVILHLSNSVEEKTIKQCALSETKNVQGTRSHQQWELLMAKPFGRVKQDLLGWCSVLESTMKMQLSCLSKKSHKWI